MQVSTAYSSTSLSFASQSSEVALSTPSGSPKVSSTDRVAISEMALQSLSLSASGSVAGKGGKEGKEGKEIGFSFDLSYDHASFAAQSAQVQKGPEGISLSYAEAAAELTSTSMSFTMSQTADSGPAGAKGAPHLNDEVSRIAKEVKPLVKEFLAAAGVKGGWGDVNRFLRSVA